MMHSGGYENLASGRQTEGGQKERVNWCSVSLFVFLDPVPSMPMEQHPQKSIASALPPSPVGDVRPATHPAPLEKPSELSASGKSHFLLSGSIFPECGKHRSAFPCFEKLFCVVEPILLPNGLVMAALLRFLRIEAKAECCV